MTNACEDEMAEIKPGKLTYNHGQNSLRKQDTEKKQHIFPYISVLNSSTVTSPTFPPAPPPTMQCLFEKC